MWHKDGNAVRVAAHIKQLCCLGLGSEAIMPALLHDLHELVPSYGNSFYWVDDRFRLANVYNEVPESAMVSPLYAREFYNRRELEVHPGFSAAARLHRGVVTHDEFFSVGRRRLQRSDFYNRIMRPQGYHSILQLYLRPGGRTAGILQLHRSFREREFSQRDVHRIACLESFIAHALARRKTVDNSAMVDSGESGLIVADRRGRPVGFSPQGRRLLFLATHPRQSAGTSPALDRTLPADVARICASLADLRKDDGAGQAPVIRRGNVWGRFTFRAYWLDTDAPGAERIGITVVREEPLPLRLLRATRDLSLSQRQAEVAVLLASGHSHAAIAEQLGITRNTAISHARWVYSKLDVHDGDALRRKLLGVVA
jgi:DNA-binding CsgD family transcriptional regulator